MKNFNNVLKREAADIRLSPQLAKELVGLLSSTIDSYEETVVKIPCSNKVQI